MRWPDSEAQGSDVYLQALMEWTRVFDNQQFERCLSLIRSNSVCVFLRIFCLHNKAKLYCELYNVWQKEYSHYCGNRQHCRKFQNKENIANVSGFPVNRPLFNEIWICRGSVHFSPKTYGIPFVLQIYGNQPKNLHAQWGPPLAFSPIHTLDEDDLCDQMHQTRPYMVSETRSEKAFQCLLRSPGWPWKHQPALLRCIHSKHWKAWAENSLLGLPTFMPGSHNANRLALGIICG